MALTRVADATDSTISDWRRVFHCPCAWGGGSLTHLCTYFGSTPIGGQNTYFHGKVPWAL